MSPLTREQLQEALAQLEAKDVLTKNDVGNLAIIRNGDYIGFVDLATGELELEGDRS